MRALVHNIGWLLGWFLTEAMVVLVRIYQWTLSPIVGRQCRFEPTCSHYMIGALRKYGPIVGVWRGTKRICRCHPFHNGPWYDPP